MTTVERKESKRERYHVETQIAVTPCEPPPAEEDAGQPGDLFACPDTGHFFTVKNMKVETTARNISASKTFLCPVCVTTTVLTFTPSNKRGHCEPLAKCLSCGWDTSHCNVNDIGDLLQRVKMPYPWLDAHFRALKANRVNGNANNGNSNISGNVGVDDNHGSNGSSLSFGHGHGSKVKLGTHSKATERLAMLRRQSGIGSMEETEPPMRDVSRFSDAQAAHERKVFQEYMPEPSVPINLNHDEKDSDVGNVKEMCKDLEASTLMEGDDRKASGIWFRRQAGPMQRIKAPHVVVKSGLTGKVVNSRWDSAIYDGDDHMECTGAYIIPKVLINMKGWGSKSGVCGSHGNETDILISVRNERQLSATVHVENWIDRTQAVEFKVAAGELFTTKMKGVKWLQRSVRQWNWMDGLCDHVVKLEMQVKYDMKRGKNQSCGQSTMEKWQKLCCRTWRVCFYVRHATTVSTSFPMSGQD